MSATETTTRNAELAELAAAAHEFLLSYAGLPDIASARLDARQGLDGCADIELQISSRRDAGIQEMAAWARELGTTVRFRDSSESLEISAWTTAHRRSVKIWDRVRFRSADRVLARLGIELVDGGSVEVDPTQLLAPASMQDTRPPWCGNYEPHEAHDHFYGWPRQQARCGGIKDGA